MVDKINKITCTFEDSDLERKYFDDKWIKVSSFYFKVIIFFIFASSMYLISLIIRDMIALKSVINPIIFITFPLFLILKSDESKKKYLEKFLLFLPIVNNPLSMRFTLH